MTVVSEVLRQTVTVVGFARTGREAIGGTFWHPWVFGCPLSHSIITMTGPEGHNVPGSVLNPLLYCFI